MQLCGLFLNLSLSFRFLFIKLITIVILERERGMRLVSKSLYVRWVVVCMFIAFESKAASCFLSPPLPLLFYC